MSEIKKEIKPNADGSYTITDAHSTADIVRWLLTQDSKETILYLLNETLAQPEQELLAWKNAALRVGEDLSSVGPKGYYNMTAQQWLDWAMAQQPRGNNSLAQPEQERNALPKAMNVVIAAMQADPGYAWSWHCNIAMAYVDEGVNSDVANQGAARFMKLLANVEPAHDILPTQTPDTKLNEQEPLAWESILGAVARGWCYEGNANKTMDSELAVAIAKEVHALYTTPPQRTWVGLTEAQCGVLWKTNMTPFEYYQAIEDKLKEKNT